jgi:uncharacterized protein YraI
MRTLRTCVVVAVLLAAAGAHAQPQFFGFATRDANLRAGPAREYPQLAVLPAGTVVQIVGCLADWRWCDVAWGTWRGFVHAGSLGHAWQDGYLVVRDGGPWLGLPIVPFSVQQYWGTWYVHQPWYPQWTYWAGRPVVRPHPRPTHWPHRPPPVQPFPNRVTIPQQGIVPPMGHPVPPFQAGRPQGPQPGWRSP